MKQLKRIYHKLAPAKCRQKIYAFRLRRCFGPMINRYYGRKDNLKAYSLEDQKKIGAILQKLRTEKPQPLIQIDASVRKQYLQREVSIHADADRGLKYIHMDGKRMYFKKSMNDEEIAAYFNYLCLEQDYASPHRYLSEDQYFFGVIGNFCNRGVKGKPVLLALTKVM